MKRTFIHKGNGKGIFIMTPTFKGNANLHYYETKIQNEFGLIVGEDNGEIELKENYHYGLLGPHLHGDKVATEASADQ